MHIGRLVVLVSILIISIGQSVDMYVPSMPHMVTALHTSESLIQLSMAIALISFGIAVFAWGPISDHYGRRAPILAGIGIFILGSLVCLFSRNIASLLIGRALQGAGIGCAGVTASLAKDVLHGEKLIKAYSHISIAMSIVPVVAPVLGGYFQNYIGWHATFAFLAAYASCVFLFILRKLPETNSYKREGVLSFARAGMNYLNIFKTSSNLRYLFCFTAIFAGEISYCVILPFIAQNTLGFTPVGNGWLIVVTATGLALGGFLSSKWSRLGWNKLLLGGLIIGTVGACAMVVCFLLGARGVFSIVLPMMLYMLGAGLIYPNCIAALMSSHPERSGVMSSLLSGLQMLGAGCILFVVAKFLMQDQSALAWMLGALSVSALGVFLMGWRE
ncbi:MAG: multidrug effflux MFS transporter [Chlamydiales bacterium]